MSSRFAVTPLRILAPVLALSLTALASFGQTTAMATPRIHSEVNPAQRVTLKGNTHPLAQPRFDRGALPDTASAGRMMMVLRRSDAQQSALDKLVAAQQDPKSGSYHKWLTPQSFGAQFGVADADVQTVASYLSSQGLTVGKIYKNKLAIEFSGTVGQVRSAFGTEIHTYAVNGQTFHANAKDPQIPAALAPVVSGVASLNNYKTPRQMAAQKMLLNPKTGKAKPLYADSNNQVESLSPGDLAVIYDIPTSTYNGSGVTVGLINDSNVNLSIPANYRTTFGLPAMTPTVIVDGQDPGITTDADLGYEQLELISAVAPSASINYYVAAGSDLDTGIDFAAIRALEEDAVQVLVFGFEGCEQSLGQAGNAIFSIAWEQAAAQGISVIVGAGSGGAAECDAPVNGNVNATATHGLAVNGYASTAYNTAVGASDFYYGPTGSADLSSLAGFPTAYWSATNGGTAGFTSALQYIPEQPANSSYQATNQVTFNPFVLATGGGVSTLGNVAQDGTQSPHPQPFYQTSVAGGISTTARVVPDVSIFAGDLTNGSTYILCVDAADCVNGAPDALQYTAGGSSPASAAVFGGMAALLVQAKGVQGNLNPTLYALYGTTPSAFHDITAGTNAVNCTTGSPDCANGYTSNSNGLAYQAGAGYDAASGLGSVDLGNLISAWTNAGGSATVAMTITQPGTTTPVTGPVMHGQPVQLNVTVSGSSATPTGDVSVTTTSPMPSGPGVEVLTLSNGQAVDNFLNVLPGGSYNLVVRYAGDSNYGPAVASLPITISAVGSTMDALSQTFTNGATLPYGASVQFTLEVFNSTNNNDVGTPTGSIAIFDNGNRVTALPLNSEGFTTFLSTKLSSGAHTFTASYSGDQSYNATTLTGTSPTVTIGGAPTSTTLSASAADLPSINNGTIALVATVTSTTAGTTGKAPGGSVRFTTGSGVVLGTVALDKGSVTGANPSSYATYRLSRTSLPTGSSTTLIAAKYVPDATGDYTVSVSAPIAITSEPGRNLVTTHTTLTTTPVGAVNFLNTGSLIFSVKVVQLAGAVIPTGTVRFYSGATMLGSTTLDSTGLGYFNIPADPNTGFLALPLGQSILSAEYSGDVNHANSSQVYTVNMYGEASTPDFTMQSTKTYGTISPSMTTTAFTLQFGSLNNFAALGETINLTTTGPAEISCTLSTNALKFATTANYKTATMTCGPAAGVTVAQVTPANPHMLWLAEGGTALACIFLFGMPTRRRNWQSLVGSLALIVVGFSMTGCGISNPHYLQPGTSTGYAKTTGANASGVLAAGTYTVLVNGSANVFTNAQPNTTVTVVHNLPVTIVVQ